LGDISLVNNKTPLPPVFREVRILKEFKYFRINTFESVDSKRVMDSVDLGGQQGEAGIEKLVYGDFSEPTIHASW